MNEKESERISAPDQNNTSEASPVVIAIAGDRAPEDPPDKPKTNWSTKFFRNDDRHQAPLVSKNLLESGKMKVSFPEGENGAPWISVEQDVMDTLATPWRCSVVVTGEAFREDDLLNSVREETETIVEP